MILHELKNYCDNVTNRGIQGSQIANLKDAFINIYTNDNPQLIDPVREFLCEAFCIIDILDEIQLNLSPQKRNLRNMSAEKKHREREANYNQSELERSSFPADTSLLQQFASPSQEERKIGIDVNMISPIPNRGDNNRVGSASRYHDVSQDQTQA